jgi:acetyl-CoA C-acetyltransferase
MSAVAVQWKGENNVMGNCVITGAARTAVGGYLGGLKTVFDYDLLYPVLEEAVKRSNIEKGDVKHIIMGSVISKTPNVARVASLLAGFPLEIPAFSVDRQCGSGLQAVASATKEILTGDADIVLAGGAENMSMMPYYLPSNVRYQGFRMNAVQIDDAFEWGVQNVHPPKLYPNMGMGMTAENVAAKHNITREQQDEFAVHSHAKAVAAKKAGKFKDEILPIEVKSRKDSVIITEDEHMREGVTVEQLSKLKAVFKKDGSVTAGNASGMNDGASAVVVMAEETAKARNIKPLARILSSASVGVGPEVMGLGPVPSSKLALERAGLTLDDIGLIEINEAFAAQALGCLIELGIQPGTKGYDKVNVNGGAVAHGHPLGNSGSRILITLIYEMKRRNVKYGLATLCIGGGQGIAMIVENI